MQTTPEKQTILIIDDDKDFKDIVSLKLTRSGFAVVTADNGKQGLSKLQTLQPDIVLLDMSMPEMDGAETLWHIRHDLQLDRLPVAFLTSYGENQTDLRPLDAQYASQAGADGYIKKTDDLDSVLKQIRSILFAKKIQSV